jgi:hypothetical protein
MGSDQQVLVVANVGKQGLPSTPGLEVNVAMRHGSLYVDDWVAPTGIGGTTPGTGIAGHTHDYDTRNVKVSEYAGTPAGSDNVVVGNAAGDALGALSAENVIVGSSAGSSAANDAESVVIGYNAGNYEATATSQTWDTLYEVDSNDSIFAYAANRGTPKGIAKLSSTHVLVTYESNDANLYLKARVVDTSGPTIGTEVEISDDEVGFWSVAAFDGTHFVAVYTKFPGSGSFDLYMRAGSISGTTITMGTEVEIDDVTPNAIHVEKLTSTAALLTTAHGGGGSGGGNCYVIQLVLPTTLSIGSAWQFSANSVTGVYSAILTQYKAVVGFIDAGDSDKLKLRVANVAGTTVTYGATTYTVSSDAQYSTVGKGLSSSKFIFSYDNQTDGGEGQAIAGTVAGDAITLGTESTFYSAGTLSTWHSIAVINADQVVIVYDYTGDWGFYSKGGRLSGTTITWDAQSSLTGTTEVAYGPQVVALSNTSLYVVLGSSDTTEVVLAVTGTHDDGGAGGTRTGNVFVGAGAGGGGEVSTNVCIGLEAGANEVNDSRLYIDISNTAAPLIYGEFDDRNLGINTVDMASGEGVIAIANASVVPSGTPTAGGVLYVESGALKYKGSSGTVTTLGVA